MAKLILQDPPTDEQKDESTETPWKEGGEYDQEEPRVDEFGTGIGI